MHFNEPDNANAQRRYLVMHAVRLRLVALHFFKIQKGDSELWYFDVDTFFFCSVYFV